MLFFVTLAIGLAIGLGVVAGDIEKYFGEGEPITWLSFLQLLVVSGLSWKVFRSYNTISDLRPWRSPHILWLIIAIGFLFLAFDEVA
ncbi:MAG: hypothetical protein SV062_09700, partial [Thermodesulfobacteriota bacterium]|nr:hypothetical protein [Thermodesulfobacteriota bacterium]